MLPDASRKRSDRSSVTVVLSLAAAVLSTLALASPPTARVLLIVPPGRGARRRRPGPIRGAAPADLPPRRRIRPRAGEGRPGSSRGRSVRGRALGGPRRPPLRLAGTGGRGLPAGAEEDGAGRAPAPGFAPRRAAEGDRRAERFFSWEGWTRFPRFWRGSAPPAAVRPPLLRRRRPPPCLRPAPLPPGPPPPRRAARPDGSSTDTSRPRGQLRPPRRGEERRPIRTCGAVTRRSTYDAIVVGGGPAGLSAALILGRCRRSVLVCDTGRPRNAVSRAMHGFLSRDGIPPRELLRIGRRQLSRYGVELLSAEVTDARRTRSGFEVVLAGGRRLSSRTLLIATGVVDHLPAVEGVEKVFGRSVFHCPYCDGWEASDRPLGVYGRGRSGMGLSLSLRTWSQDVVLFTNGSARLTLLERRRLRKKGVGVVEKPIVRFEPRRGGLSVVFGDGERCCAGRALLLDRAGAPLRPAAAPGMPLHREGSGQDGPSRGDRRFPGSTSPATRPATSSSRSWRPPRARRRPSR